MLHVQFGHGDGDLIASDERWGSLLRLGTRESKQGSRGVGWDERGWFIQKMTTPHKEG